MKADERVTYRVFVLLLMRDSLQCIYSYVCVSAGVVAMQAFEAFNVEYDKSADVPKADMKVVKKKQVNTALAIASA
jgi:hypothetical protein